MNTLKIRADRRIGEISRELDKAKPGPESKILPNDGKTSKAVTLKAAGISTIPRPPSWGFCCLVSQFRL